MARPQTRALTGVDGANAGLADTPASKGDEREQIVGVAVTGVEAVEGEAIDELTGKGGVAALAVAEARNADGAGGEAAEQGGAGAA